MGIVGLMGQLIRGVEERRVLRRLRVLSREPPMMLFCGTRREIG